ncbi:MAG: C40 family peptidase [Bacteroidia bacterium]|nr:C40 family peptidase [Bacteroidia bacterium]
MSIVPVRSQPSDRSEQTTQLLFGDSYQVLDHSPDKKWLYIENDFDAYRGWIDAGQFRPVSERYRQDLLAEPHPLSGDLVACLNWGKRHFPILLGSVLPFYQDDRIRMEEEIIRVKLETPPTLQIRLMDAARKYWLAPYQWGGKSPFGLDCSGFIQQVFRMAACSLPRDAYQQAEKGEAVPSVAQSRVADLAFFAREGRIVHVGLILDDLSWQHYHPDLDLQAHERPIMHALDQVRVDKLDKEGIWHLGRKQYTHHLLTIRRLKEEFF